MSCRVARPSHLSTGQGCLCPFVDSSHGEAPWRSMSPAMSAHCLLRAGLAQASSAAFNIPSTRWSRFGLHALLLGSFRLDTKTWLCIYIYIYIHTHTHTYIYIYIYIYVYFFLYLFAYLFLLQLFIYMKHCNMLLCRLSCLHVCMHACRWRRRCLCLAGWLGGWVCGSGGCRSGGWVGGWVTYVGIGKGRYGRPVGRAVQFVGRSTG